MKRVIVCGSRSWWNDTQIQERLADLASEAVLVHGDCDTGADRIASEYWRWLGREDEPHPADWDGHGRRAGPIRNSEMAALGADVCIAFRGKGKSNGTDDMVRKARAAGIPIELIQEETP